MILITIFDLNININFYKEIFKYYNHCINRKLIINRLQRIKQLLQNEN